MILGSEDVCLCDIYESGGKVAGWRIHQMAPSYRKAVQLPSPLTPPHSNWPLFPVPLPSLHAHQDDDIATTSSLFNSTFLFGGLLLTYQLSVTFSAT